MFPFATLGDRFSIPDMFALHLGGGAFFVHKGQIKSRPHSFLSFFLFLNERNDNKESDNEKINK